MARTIQVRAFTCRRCHKTETRAICNLTTLHATFCTQCQLTTHNKPPPNHNCTPSLNLASPTHPSPLVRTRNVPSTQSLPDFSSRYLKPVVHTKLPPNQRVRTSVSNPAQDAISVSSGSVKVPGETRHQTPRHVKAYVRPKVWSNPRPAKGKRKRRKPVLANAEPVIDACIQISPRKQSRRFHRDTNLKSPAATPGAKLKSPKKRARPRKSSIANARHPLKTLRNTLANAPRHVSSPVQTAIAPHVEALTYFPAHVPDVPATPLAGESIPISKRARLHDTTLNRPRVATHVLIEAASRETVNVPAASKPIGPAPEAGIIARGSCKTGSPVVRDPTPVSIGNGGIDSDNTAAFGNTAEDSDHSLRQRLQSMSPRKPATVETKRVGRGNDAPPTKEQPGKTIISAGDKSVVQSPRRKDVKSVTADIANAGTSPRQSTPKKRFRDGNYDLNVVVNAVPKRKKHQEKGTRKNLGKNLQKNSTASIEKNNDIAHDRNLAETNDEKLGGESSKRSLDKGRVENRNDNHKKSGQDNHEESPAVVSTPRMLECAPALDGPSVGSSRVDEGFKLSIKAVLERSDKKLTRRFAAEEDWTFETFLNHIAKVFGARADLAISYVDEEGDEVGISTTNEFSEMLVVAKKYGMSPLRLMVSEPSE